MLRFARRVDTFLKTSCSGKGGKSFRACGKMTQDDSQIFVLISVCRDYLDAILALQDHINDNLDDLNTSRLELNCEGHQSAHYVVQKWKQSFRSIGFIRLPKTGKFHMETGAQNLEWQRNFISSTMVSCWKARPNTEWIEITILIVCPRRRSAFCRTSVSFWRRKWSNSDTVCWRIHGADATEQPRTRSSRRISSAPKTRIFWRDVFDFFNSLRMKW